jgi:predicted lipoprotein with Yx(FWY)xxD motif
MSCQASEKELNMVTRSSKHTQGAHSAGRLGRRLKLACAVAGIGLVAAACGSSSAGTTTTTTTIAAGEGSTTTPAGGSGTVTVKATTVAGKTALVDTKGFTLYVYALDKPGKIACTGACTTTWPPLLVPSGTHLSMSMSGLATVTRPGGQVQVTYKGSPLYTFSGDTAPGQANGVGIPDWSVATSGSGSSGTVTTTTSSGGGYGY